MGRVCDKRQVVTVGRDEIELLDSPIDYRARGIPDANANLLLAMLDHKVVYRPEVHQWMHESSINGLNVAHVEDAKECHRCLDMHLHCLLGAQAKPEVLQPLGLEPSMFMADDQKTGAV